MTNIQEIVKVEAGEVAGGGGEWADAKTLIEAPGREEEVNGAKDHAGTALAHE